MEMPKANLTNLTKSLTYGDRPRPLRDWFVLLAVTLVLLLASVGWNLWTFDRVTDGEPLGETAEISQINTESVDRASALFERRELEADRYLREYRFVDPSR